MKFRFRLFVVGISLMLCSCSEPNSLKQLEGSHADLWLYGLSRSNAAPEDGVIRKVGKNGILIENEDGSREWYPLDRIYQIRNISNR